MNRVPLSRRSNEQCVSIEVRMMRAVFCFFLIKTKIIGNDDSFLESKAREYGRTAAADVDRRSRIRWQVAKRPERIAHRSCSPSEHRLVYIEQHHAIR